MSRLNFREPTELDLPTIKNWIDRDSCPQHNGVLPEWWASKDKGTKCFAVEDKDGVVFYLKLENVMRCYVQFPPDQERDALRTALALKETFLTLAAGGPLTGYHEIIFSTKSEGLVNLFTNPKRKFGFKHSEDDYLVRI
jgi:hypothetical protein